MEFQLLKSVKFFKNQNVKLSFYTVKNNQRFFGKVKDKCPKLNKSGVVYQVECSCNKIYIGQTGQYLKERLRQHKNEIRKGEEKTGLSAHVANTTHEIYWDNVKILENESFAEKRKFLETANIVRSTNTLNIQKDFKPCNLIYQNFLKRFQ